MKHTAGRKRVAIWIRVSTEEQAQGDSPQHHEARARQYAGFKEWDVVEVYHLEGISGKSVIAQQETQRMLEDIKRGHITGLLFSKLARLARNTKELLEFSEVFERHGAHLISLQESIDTSSPVGRFFYTIIAAMAQWEREEIADRISASIPIRAKLGKPLNGKAPFGYKWENKKLVPNPQEVPMRQLIYELFVKLKRKHTVAQELNKMGHRTREGKCWSDMTVSRMLTDTTPKGLFRQNYTRTRPDGRPELKPESDWVYTPVEPIVPEDLWNECQRILEEQTQGRKPYARTAINLFSGLTYCGSCGDKMYVPSNNPKYTCKGCKRKIPCADLEAIFYEQLKTFFVSTNAIKGYLSQADNELKSKEAQLGALQSEKGRVRQEMDSVYRLYISGSITETGFAERYSPLETRYRELEEKIPRLEGELDYLRVNSLSSDYVAQGAQDLYSHWPNLAQADKRKVIETITDKVQIGDGEVTIDLFHIPSSEILATSQRGLNAAYSR